SHAYTDNGTYTVTLTVTDDDGATATASSTKTVSNRPPIASFTESAETVYTGETIYFNASDSYDPDGTTVSYFWDFGDGTNATGVTVDHSYADDGNYTVTLTITDDDGATSSTSSTKIVLNTPPIAVFTESTETGYTNETITFNASQSYDPDGSIVSYFWDFGDGTNVTGTVVVHSYMDDGNYTVTLTVTDNDGASTPTSATKTILNRPPVAVFTESTETVNTGEIISFDASDSYDPDGTIVSFFWDFGDGTNASGVTIGHAYADNGTYTVTLIITDDDGATAIATSVKTVLNRPPVATFTQSATVVYTGEIIQFDASGSSDPDGVIVSYFWDFGDGTNATGVIVNHAYTGDGTYMVTLVVTDDDGATTTATGSTNVLNRPPVAVFTESAETVYTNEVISFDASDSYDPDGTIVSYFWDFGDGTNASGVTVGHAYSEDGLYTVTLTVTDDDGASASTSATKTVLNRPPVASFTESAESVLVGETIYFNASASYDPDGTIVSYFWDFGDGANGTSMTVEHTYIDDGDYTVTLTVTDDDGVSENTTSAKTVLNMPPMASFAESAETVYVGQPIMFNASGSYDSDGFIVSYFWDFGDGTNATGIVVEHAYSINGTYTVTLTVSDDDDASDSTSATKTILWNEKPVASFTESTETAYTSEAIYLNASNSYDSDGYITSYFWDFGDGTNATGIVVEHGYADNGNYTVMLTVTDDNGAINTASASKTILNRSPVALFTESTEIVYTGEAITFNASDSYDPDGVIVSYFWDFGDGTNATGVALSHSYTDNGTYTVTLTVTDDDDAYNSTSAIKTVLNSSPVAVFTESGETVYTSQSIMFNASGSYDSDGFIVSYFWDFGDGTNATGVIVGHVYSLNGTFTVTLNVTDNEGASDATTATKTILWNEPPVALFTESAETIYQGETITFNASSSYDLDGAIAGYFWDFGDGTNATDVAVEHTYLYDGNYTVTLNVTDDRGATYTVSATKTVLNRVPVVLFTESSTTVYTGEVITFNASESYDSDGFILSYLWDFGDGTNATDIVVTHVYDDDGQYTVTLTLVDNNGGTSSASAIKTILNRLPVAIFTTSSTTVYTGEVITFNASESYDPDGTIVSYFWDFGDGNTAYGVIVNHAYSYDRRYLVTLTITDDDVAQNTTTVRLMVLNRSPVANFVESTETSWVGVPIAFDASDSYDADGYIANYLWDFGDGTNATGVTVSHTYSINGTFAVVLTVTDDDGAFGSVQAAKTILENELPIASFIESAETVYTSETIIFNASNSYDSDGYIASYLWDFGDGANATGIVVEHGFVDNGNYTVTLTVTDDKGATNSATVVKTVLNRLPVPSFTESVETAYVGEIIDFNASASYDSDGYITGYFWDFGDGTNATGMVVEHAYLVNETFAVVLTVTDDDGAFGSVQAAKTILGGIPDVAIVNVTSTTEVYKHQVLNVSVIVANEGTEVETFNVTLYASEVHGWHLIEMDSNLVWYSNGKNSGDFLLVTSTSIPADSPMLTFETKYNIEHLYDFGFVQISTDEGATWASLENAYTTHEHQPDTDSSIIANLPGFTGTGEGWPEWMTMTFNLSDYAGETVLLGFRYMTDLGHLEEGWYINNVAINGFIISNQAFEQLNPPTLNAIQTLTVINLAPTEQTTLIFSWNTTSTLSGKYSISAIASTVKGETDTLDNVYVDGIVKVKMNPDIDGDGDVDIFDVVAVTGIYGCLEGEPCWDPRADLVEDGVINIYDVVIVASHYGETIEL
ncbi:MAG: PKD domain-containing protein, partial [Candidatus Bathyarchaeota archaeon]|nr:PKD domain-containing protein [Candidatus Bathyarchaeota archaeon]